MVKKRLKRPARAAQQRAAASGGAASSSSSATSSGIIKACVVALLVFCVLQSPLLQQDNGLSVNSVLQSSSASDGSIGTRDLEPKKKRRHPQFNESWTIFQRIEAEQTGRVLTPPPQDTRPMDVIMAQRKVEFMEFHIDVTHNDANSGSWLQRKSDFMTMKLDQMSTWQDACLFVYHDAPDDNRAHLLHMPVDMLDFNVEHLVAWWDILRVYENDIPFLAATSKLEKYVKQNGDSSEDSGLFREAIAVIVFSEYTGPEGAEAPAVDKRDQLNALALAATLESVRRIGFGRAIVVGQIREQLFGEALQYLDSTKLGQMQVGFVKPGLSSGTTPATDPLPKATLLGLREAFTMAEQDPSNAHSKAWLGEKPDYWKYVYLTEHGSILNHRPISLMKMKEDVDRGRAMLPHRLQPIPHASDVAGARRTDTYLPTKDPFDTVVDIDGNRDTCCDDNPKSQPGPGMPPWFPACGKPWFQCGFGDDPASTLEQTDKLQERLRPYKLMRLAQGSGITVLAGSATGRRCTPLEKGTGCMRSNR